MKNSHNILKKVVYYHDTVLLGPDERMKFVPKAQHSKESHFVLYF